MISILISAESYKAAWPDSPPPFSQFLAFADDQLLKQINSPHEELSAAIKTWGRKRVRIDGAYSIQGVSYSYYLEIIWLSPSQSFRANGSSWKTIMPSAPKTVAVFIEALNQIRDESKTTLYGQIFTACEGVAPHDPQLPFAYPAIRALLERFSNEDLSDCYFLHALMRKDQG